MQTRKVDVVDDADRRYVADNGFMSFVVGGGKEKIVDGRKVFVSIATCKSFGFVDPV